MSVCVQIVLSKVWGIKIKCYLLKLGLKGQIDNTKREMDSSDG